MKKRIKNKHLPKFDFSGDLSSINRAKSATATVTGPTVPLANGLTQQASDNLSFDSGLSSTPNFGMSTKTGNIIGGVGSGIGAMSSFIPEDNDGHGVSRTGQKVSSGIQKGMDTAGEVASSFGPMGQAVGGVLKLGSFLVKGFTALADAVKEQKNPKDEKWDKQYNVVNPNASKLDFGVPQGKFGLPLFPNGGKPQPWWRKALDVTDEVLSAPQRTATWAVTGALTGHPKYEDPSDALGIDDKKHPYLKLATDIALDPTNLLGVGLVSKAGKILKGARTLEEAKKIIKTKRVFEAEKYLAAQQKANELGKAAAGLAKEPGIIKTFTKAAKPYHKAYLESFNSAWDATNGFTKVVKDSNKAAKALPIALINDLIRQNPDKEDNIRKYYNVPKTTNTTTSTSNSSVKPIIKKTSQYDTQLDSSKEQAYQKWKQTLPKNLQYEGDYDLRGFYKDNPNFNVANPEQHLTDKYKKPNHPTFSVESKYYKKGMPAGTWDGDTYVPINRENKTQQAGAVNIQSQDWNDISDIQPQQQEQSKGQPLPDFLIQTVKTPNGVKTYKRKDRSSPWMETYALGGVPHNQADIEAEQGEAMLGADNNVQNIEGQKHEQGGTPLALKGDEQYIYSDRLGYNKQGIPTININDVTKSFASKAKSIERKYSKKSDDIANKTKEMELQKLTQDAEQTRQLKEQVDMSKDVRKMQAKYGKDLRKFWGGGDPNNVIMTPEEMKALYEQLNLQAKGVSSGLNTTIGEMKQTSQQLDANTQRLQQMSNPQINTPLYNLSSKYDGHNSQTEPITLKTPWGTYDRSGNLKNNINPITPIGPKKLNIENTNLGITNTPTAGTTINAPLFTGNLPSGPQQDMNGIGIEKPGDNYGAGIGVYGKQPSTGRNGLFKNLTTGDKLGLASMLPGTLYNFAMGLKPAEKEKFYTNPYQNEIVGLMQNRRFDAQPFINEATMANEAANQNISDNASSVGVKLANMQKAQANYVNSLASITGKAQEINNNYRAEEAQVKNNLGEVLRQEGIRQAGVNAQNKAAKQAFMAKAMTQLGQGIAAVGQASNQSLTNTILAKSLSELSPDFDVKKLKDLYDRGQVDESGYFTFNGSKYQYIPSQTGRAEDGQVVKVTQDLGLPINKKTLYPPMTFTTTTTKKGK